jgi:hypothetical protein
VDGWGWVRRDAERLVTTFQDVEKLAEAGKAQGVLPFWSENAEATKRAWAHAYLETELHPAELAHAAQRSCTSLVGMQAKDVPPVLRDAYVGWPLAFLVRGAMQHYLRVPTVDEFIACLKRFPDFWVTPMWSIAQEHGIDRYMAWEAMKYRARTAWQSFIREQMAFAQLRGMGIPVQSHPLADVELKVDGWAEQHLFAIYVQNTEFLDRKQPSPLKGMTTHALVAPKQPGTPGVWFVPEQVLWTAVERMDGGMDTQMTVG